MRLATDFAEQLMVKNVVVQDACSPARVEGRLVRSKY